MAYFLSQCIVIRPDQSDTCLHTIFECRFKYFTLWLFLFSRTRITLWLHYQRQLCAILPVSLKLDFFFVLFCSLVCVFSVSALVEQTTAHCGATFVNLALLKISAQLQPQITSNCTLLKERRRQNANAKKEQMCAIITLRHRIRGKKKQQNSRTQTEITYICM